MVRISRSAATVAAALALAAAAPMAQAAPPAKQPQLVVGDATATEGDAGRTAMAFTVSLSAPSSKVVSVDVASENGSATADTDDYVPAAVTLVFAKGQTHKQIVVDVVGDTRDEPDETLAVRLSNARNAVVTDGLGLGTIVDDDETPHTLAVARAGSGSGTVTSDPAGIDCGSTCSADYAPGTVVTLTPAAVAGSTFTGWSGDCTGTGTCQVVMDGARSVTATFTAAAPTTYTLSVQCTVADGFNSTPCAEYLAPPSVTSDDLAINCGDICTAEFTDGDTVVLRANPSIVTGFAGWGGDCASAGTNDVCTLVVDRDMSVNAAFLTVFL